jgi:hypothetical protein
MKLDKKAVQGFEPELMRLLEPFIDQAEAVAESMNASRETFAGLKKPGLWLNEYRRFIGRYDRQRSARLKRLLFQIANLYDPENLPIDARRLLDSFQFDPPPSGARIATMQRFLQHIWRRDLPAEVKQQAVSLLFAIIRHHCWMEPLLLSQRLELAPHNFLGQVMTGILENWPNMAKCANPDCMQAYFWAKRVTQVYCERGECTRYGLRKKALKSWRKKHGKSTKEGEY